MKYEPYDSQGSIVSKESEHGLCIHICNIHRHARKEPKQYSYLGVLYHRKKLYVVATICTLLKIVVLFCKRALQKRRYSAKETYNLKEPLVVATPFDTSGPFSVQIYFGSCRKKNAVLLTMLSEQRVRKECRERVESVQREQRVRVWESACVSLVNSEAFLCKHSQQCGIFFACKYRHRHTQIQTQTQTYARTHTHTHTHTHIHAHTHTHTCAYIIMYCQHSAEQAKDIQIRQNRFSKQYGLRRHTHIDTHTQRRTYTCAHTRQKCQYRIERVESVERAECVCGRVQRESREKVERGQRE